MASLPLHQPIEANLNGVYGLGTNNKPTFRLVLWDINSTLNWAYDTTDVKASGNTPFVARPKDEVAKLLNDGLALWDNIASFRLNHVLNKADAHFIVKWQDSDNDGSSASLAEAFFPEEFAHIKQAKLLLYPDLYSFKEPFRVITLAHEFGHIFGLRHTIEVLKDNRENHVHVGEYGTTKKKSVMAYGSDCVITPHDKAQLAQLYQSAHLKQPIRLHHHITKQDIDATVSIATSTNSPPRVQIR